MDFKYQEFKINLCLQITWRKDDEKENLMEETEQKNEQEENRRNWQSETGEQKIYWDHDYWMQQK